MFAEYDLNNMKTLHTLKYRFRTHSNTKHLVKTETFTAP